VRVTSARTGQPTARRDHRAHASGPGLRWTVPILAVLTIGLAAGCGVFGGSKAAGDKAATEKKLPPDSPAALRQDMDRLRADIADLRTKMESAQRAGTDYADRVGRETRSEFDAMQKAMEASARNDVQRQVEVLDAQARRIDLLEKRATELGQALRRIELSLGGLESQLSRILEGNRPPSAGTGARGTTTSRAPASTPAAPSRGSDDTPAPASPSPSDSSMSTAAAGAGLTPPAMLGSARSAKSAPTAPVTPAPSTQPTERAPADASVAASSPKTTPGDATRVAKTAPPGTDDRTPPPRPAKSGTPAGPASVGSLSARALFDRGMDSWNRGERGQAVLDFEELIQTYPSDPLAASAQFRVGEAYYAARDFERAALEYRKAVSLAPKGKDTPQALLRLGLAYRAQKKEADARQAWNQLIRDFPDSDATEEARRALTAR
jgi:tol-pal system protein YbgF